MERFQKIEKFPRNTEYCSSAVINVACNPHNDKRIAGYIVLNLIKPLHFVDLDNPEAFKNEYLSMSFNDHNESRSR